MPNVKTTRNIKKITNIKGLTKIGRLAQGVETLKNIKKTNPNLFTEIQNKFKTRVNSAEFAFNVQGLNPEKPSIHLTKQGICFSIKGNNAIYFTTYF